MRHPMSQSARKELVQAQSERYRTAKRGEKGRILDELVAATGYNRCYAMTLLSGRGSTACDVTTEREPRPRKGVYTQATIRALETVWTLSGCLCSKRLVPYLPEFCSALERCGELSLEAFTKDQLLALSPSTVDRYLASPRRARTDKGLSATRHGALLKSQIPIRTFADWEDAAPGFCEADLVVHTSNLSLDHLSTLTVTDVFTGWTVCRPLMHKGQEAVTLALSDIQRRLPYPLLGLDTDNGSEFINQEMLRFCQTRAITFTRGRPRRKNDQCKVEQKNGRIVRSLVGYDRYAGVLAYRKLGALYHYASLWVNFFQPSQKLMDKTRQGAKVTKSYDEAKTPYQRTLDAGQVSEEHKEALRQVYQSLNPVTLRKQLQEAQQQLWLLANPTNSDS